MSKILFYNFLDYLVSKRTFYYNFKPYAEVYMFCYNPALIANCLLEDDLELEIMINTPPAPSVESLALAHLQDDPLGPTSPPSLRFSPDTKGMFATHSFQLYWQLYLLIKSFATKTKQILDARL